MRAMYFSDKAVFLLSMVLLIGVPLIDSGAKKNHTYESSSYANYRMDRPYEDGPYAYDDDLNDWSFNDRVNEDEMGDPSAGYSNVNDMNDGSGSYSDEKNDGFFKAAPKLPLEAGSSTLNFKRGSADDNNYKLDSSFENTDIFKKSIADIPNYNFSDVNNMLEDWDVDDTYKPKNDFNAESVMNSASGLEMDGFMNCICGTSESPMNISLDVNDAKILFKEVADSISTNQTLTNLYQTFTDINDCHLCEVGIYDCKLRHAACIERTIKFEIVSEQLGEEINMSNIKVISSRSTPIFPMRIDVPIGGLKNYTRQKRDISNCFYPEAMKTAAIVCVHYKRRTKCIQQCAYGYTLEKGIRQEIRCKFEEDIWKPNGFKECQPFVDCNVKLIAGGSANCSRIQTTPYDPPECKIQCEAQEDYPALNATSYFCDADEKWSPPLPHCAAPNSLGLHLAKTPKIKYHNLYGKIKV